MNINKTKLKEALKETSCEYCKEFKPGDTCSHIWKALHDIIAKKNVFKSWEALLKDVRHVGVYKKYDTFKLGIQSLDEPVEENNDYVILQENFKGYVIGVFPEGW